MAEEPVTARIRANSVEKSVEVAEELKAVEVKPGGPPAWPHASGIAMPEPVKPDYRQSVTRCRRGKEAQLRLS
jgi:hypothetical protein